MTTTETNAEDYQTDQVVYNLKRGTSWRVTRICIPLADHSPAIR